MNIQSFTLPTTVGGTIQGSSVSRDKDEGQPKKYKFLSRKVNLNQPSKASAGGTTVFANSLRNSKFTKDYSNSKSAQSACKDEISHLTDELKKAKEALTNCRLNKYVSTVNSEWKNKVSTPDKTINNVPTVNSGSVTTSSSSLSASGQDIGNATSATTPPLASATARSHEAGTAGQTTLSVMSATSGSTTVVTTVTPDSTALPEITDATVDLTRLAPSPTTADGKATSSANLFSETTGDAASASGKMSSSGVSTTSLPGLATHESVRADQTTPVMSATSGSTATLMPGDTLEAQNSTSQAGAADATSVPTKETSSQTTVDKASSSASLLPEASTASASGKESSGGSSTASLTGAGIHQSRTADKTTLPVTSATSNSTAVMPGNTVQAHDSSSFTASTDTTSALSTMTPSQTAADQASSSASPFAGTRQSEATLTDSGKETGNGTSTKSLLSPTPVLIKESGTSDQKALSTPSAANQSTITPTILFNHTTELVNSTTLLGINTTSAMSTLAPSSSIANNATSSPGPFPGLMLANDMIIANHTFEQGITNSTITPTTALPTLRSLVAKEVESTLISKLARSLTNYQLQNPLEDLSAQTEFLDKVIEFYQVVSLVTGLTSFAMSIKDSHPEITKTYEDKLNKITDEISNAVKRRVKAPRENAGG